MIRAECHTKGYELATEFDAESWFVDACADQMAAALEYGLRGAPVIKAILRSMPADVRAGLGLDAPRPGPLDGRIHAPDVLDFLVIRRPAMYQRLFREAPLLMQSLERQAAADERRGPDPVWRADSRFSLPARLLPEPGDGIVQDAAVLEPLLVS